MDETCIPLGDIRYVLDIQKGILCILVAAFRPFRIMTEIMTDRSTGLPNNRPANQPTDGKTGS